MRAIDLLLSLAYVCTFKIIKGFVSQYKKILLFPFEKEPSTVAMSDVQSSLNLRRSAS